MGSRMQMRSRYAYGCGCEVRVWCAGVGGCGWVRVGEGG